MKKGCRGAYLKYFPQQAANSAGGANFIHGNVQKRK